MVNLEVIAMKELKNTEKVSVSNAREDNPPDKSQSGNRDYTQEEKYFTLKKIPTYGCELKVE